MSRSEQRSESCHSPNAERPGWSAGLGTGGPIHAHAAQHEALLFEHVRALAGRAGAANADLPARHLLLLKERAIVTAHVEGRRSAAEGAKAAAGVLPDTSSAP